MNNSNEKSPQHWTHTCRLLVEKGPFAADDPVQTEAQYHQIWTHRVEPLQDAPLQMAVAGGYCSDQFAWIFLAGYQAAIRKTFDVEFEGWGAFAVSEDRSEENPLPGVEWKKSGACMCVSGYKTWVAASRFVRQLFVKAGRGENARYLQVPVPSTGLSIVHKDNLSMLPQLSQGIAGFEDVKVPEAGILGAGKVSHFGDYEAFYIYVAFLAYARRMITELSEHQEVLAAKDAEQLMSVVERNLNTAELLARDDSFNDLETLAEFSSGTQHVRKVLADSRFKDDAAWLRDQKLVAMYGRRWSGTN